MIYYAIAFALGALFAILTPATYTKIKAWFKKDVVAKVPALDAELEAEIKKV
jgi:hypothetical protein